MAEDTPSVHRSPRDAHAGQNGEAANGTGLVSKRTATRPRVALIGRAGAGRSALARALFGAQHAPAANGDIARYQDDATPVVVDDVPGWVSGAESDLRPILAYLDRAPGADGPLVATWYVLDAASARVTDHELQLIRRIARRHPVIVVLTRADLVADEALAAMRAAIEQAAIPNCVGVVAVAADPLPALGVAPYGVSEVMVLTTKAAEYPVTQPVKQPRAELAAQPAAPAARERAAQPPAHRDVRRDARGNARAVAAADSARSSAALITVLVAVALVLALVLLGRRSRRAESAAARVRRHPS